MECIVGEIWDDTDEIEANDEIEVDFDNGVIKNLTKGKSYQAQPFPTFIQNIIEHGGLLNSLKVNKND